MDKKRLGEIRRKTDAEVIAEHQQWIDTRDKTIEAIAKRIKASTKEA